MNIGDRVRLIHSKEEGIVTKFLKGEVVEVEIEDGFKLPVLKRELAIISKTEGQFFTKPNSQPIAQILPKPNAVKAEKGIYIAFLPLTDKELSVYFINNTDYNLPFSITTSSENRHKSIMAGFLTGRSFQQSTSNIALKDFEEWGIFNFRILFHAVGVFTEKQPIFKKLRFRSNTFFGQKKKAPLLEKDCYLFQIDAEIEPIKEIMPVINIEELKEKMFEKTVIVPQSYQKPAQIIDLHIENISTNTLAMDNSQILSLQMKHFEQKLELGIASGLDEMIFIHGIGNGVLKNEIQKQLSVHKNVAWFQDAQKEKFGYGATKIKIK